MQQRKSLVELALQVEAIKQTKKDFIVPSRQIEMDNEGRLHWGGGAYHTGVIAHEQLASKLDIPKKYYDRMKDNDIDLLSTNVNTWLKQDTDNRMLRTTDRMARAILSDRYRPLDNDVILEAVLPVLMEHSDMQVVSAEITDRRMYLSVISPKLTGDVKVGDTVQQGLTISNSEVGLGTVRVEPLWYRLACLNGMIRATAMKKYHIGKKIESDDYGFFSQQTIDVDNTAFIMKIQDTVRHSFNELAFREDLKKVSLTANNKIEANLDDAVIEVTKRFDLSKSESDSVLKNLINGGDLSQWGMGNAVTAVANHIQDYDRIIDLQRIGGRIIDLTPKEWHVIAEVA